MTSILGVGTKRYIVWMISKEKKVGIKANDKNVHGRCVVTLQRDDMLSTYSCVSTMETQCLYLLEGLHVMCLFEVVS